MQERFLDVSHEALIRGWPRLRRWLDEDRAGLRLLRRIAESAEEWDRSNRDDDLLFRGARLIQAQEWRERHEAELNPLEREFLDASIALKQRVEEEKRLREAENERVKLLLDKRRRERIFVVTVFLLGIIMLIAFAALWLVSNRARQLSEKTAADVKWQVQQLVEKGRILREKAKADLVDETNPIRNITALRNLALALNCNPRDTEAAGLASNVLLKHVWCPPAAPEVRYNQDTLLAATFAPGGSNNDIFAVAGDGQLLFWNGSHLSHVRYLFQKPKSDLQHALQPGFASFSPDGQWLLVIPPTLISAAITKAAAQSAPQQQGAPPAHADGAHEPCKVQTWRWSMQNRTYESAGEDLEISRLRGSHINFAWSYESDRVVLINARLNEAECAFFQVEGTFRELVDRSKELNRMKIVALAFAKYHGGIAAVSVDSATPALRKVSFIDADDLKVISGAMAGFDSIRLSEGFQPNDIAFGPGNDQLTLTMWSSVRILDLRDGKVTPIPPPTFRDLFMRIVIGPGYPAKRLVATSLYGRVEVAKGARMQEAAEPVVFGGSTGITQFSANGQRLLILSSGIWNVYDRMRLIDVSPLYRPREAAPEKFEEKPAPRWLADIASAVSASDPNADGSLLTLEDVRKKYPESKAGDPYEAVWKRFFPDERTER